MNIRIEPYTAHHQEPVVALSLRAWAPVFVSIKNAMDPELYEFSYPDGWRKAQQEAVEAVLADDNMHVFVALDGTANDAATTGFIAIKLHTEEAMGEIYMVAVDPATQRRGIGLALNQFALNWMKEQGMTLATVETGSDPGHAPARRTYEKTGFTLWPASRYFKKL